MADGGFPNRNRADNALTIYRDAMREYIAPILEREHGLDWISSQVLNDELRKRNPNSYERRLQSHKNGTPARNLIDLADIPFLIRNNSDAFPNLRPADAQRMHQIRDLRNEIQHADRAGDCTPEEAATIAGMCVRVLDSCGLPDAVEQIRSLSTTASAGTPAVSEAELRKQHERREWDKARLARKRSGELTPWEQERLADIQWEEEWELRERLKIRRSELPRPGILSAGSFHTVALRKDGTVVCWGSNRHDQLEEPSGRFTAVSAGGYHTVALREDGTVVCWGNNRYDQLEEPSGRFTAVSAGGYHIVALREDGTVVCWGSNRHDQLEEPSGRFIAVSAGGYHTVALRKDGTVVCWGCNRYNQLEEPSGRFIAVSAGDYHTVALREDGTVVCWGGNKYNQLEEPSGRFTTVSAGGYHTVALREDGTVVCWGDNKYNQLEEPSGRFATVSAGDYHTVALREDGTVVCWGDNGFGQREAPRRLSILPRTFHP